MANIQGTGYCGSGANAVSSANQELVVNPTNWTKFSFYKFDFMNASPCNVKINGSAPIYLLANQGFECDATQGDALIASFVIVDSGISYNFVAAY
jgi:hypothetical protein